MFGIRLPRELGIKRVKWNLRKVPKGPFHVRTDLVGRDFAAWIARRSRWWCRMRRSLGCGALRASEDLLANVDPGVWAPVPVEGCISAKIQGDSLFSAGF